MMKKSSVLTLAVAMLSVFAFAAKAQTFNVPELEVNTKSDYAKYDNDVITCVNWMENTPLDKEEEKRTAVNAFLIKWLTGTPDVTVSLNANIVTKYTDKNPQLLVFFLGGWSRYSLQNNYSKDQLRGYFEGLKSMILIYKKGVAIKKDKSLDRLVKIYEDGKLEDWIKENIKIG